MVLKIRYDGDDETETVLLGLPRGGQPRRPGGHLAELARSARALLGAHVGDTREYQLPDGGSMKVTLVSAEPFRA